MNKFKFFLKSLKKSPYLVCVVGSALIISVYGVLLKAGALTPVYAFDASAMGSDIPVVSAVHNIKAYFSPELNYEPVKFVPPGDQYATAHVDESGTKTDEESGETFKETFEDAHAQKPLEEPAKIQEQTEDDHAEEESGESEAEDTQDEEDEAADTDEDSEDEDDGEDDENDASYSPYGPFTQAGDEYFSEGALFIGDSRTKGFVLYSELENISSYAESGYAIHSIFTKKIAKTPVGNFTLDQMMAAEAGKYDKIYLKFGLNEMGWGNEELFDQSYYNLIDMLKYFQPNAVIYIQGILPVTKSKSESSKIYGSENIISRNEELRRIAENEHVCFLDIASVFTDEEGYLPEEYASDGIHLKAQYIAIWKEYLENHVIAKPEED